MQIQQEVLTRLDALAEKLGTTVEYLWPLLVKEQFVRGLVDFGIGLFVAAVAVTLLVWARSVTRNAWCIVEFDDEEAQSITSSLFFVVGLLLLLIVVPIVISGALPALITPEAAAFRSLLP